MSPNICVCLAPILTISTTMLDHNSFEKMRWELCMCLLEVTVPLIAWGLKKSLKTINPAYVSRPQFYCYSETSFGLLDLSLLVWSRIAFYSLWLVSQAAESSQFSLSLTSVLSGARPAFLLEKNVPLLPPSQSSLFLHYKPLLFSLVTFHCTEFLSYRQISTALSILH